MNTLFLHYGLLNFVKRLCKIQKLQNVISPLLTLKQGFESKPQICSNFTINSIGQIKQQN